MPDVDGLTVTITGKATGFPSSRCADGTCDEPVFHTLIGDVLSDPDFPMSVGHALDLLADTDPDRIPRFLRLPAVDDIDAVAEEFDRAVRSGRRPIVLGPDIEVVW